MAGELFGQTSQLIGGASSEQGAHTRFSQGKVPHSLQQVEGNREGHGVENERLERVYHVEQLE